MGVKKNHLNIIELKSLHLFRVNNEASRLLISLGARICLKKYFNHFLLLYDIHCVYPNATNQKPRSSTLWLQG